MLCPSSATLPPCAVLSTGETGPHGADRSPRLVRACAPRHARTMRTICIDAPNRFRGYRAAGTPRAAGSPEGEEGNRTPSWRSKASVVEVKLFLSCVRPESRFHRRHAVQTPRPSGRAASATDQLIGATLHLNQPTPQGLFFTFCGEGLQHPNPVAKPRRLWYLDGELANVPVPPRRPPIHPSLLPSTPFVRG